MSVFKLVIENSRDVIIRRYAQVYVTVQNYRYYHGTNIFTVTLFYTSGNRKV